MVPAAMACQVALVPIRCGMFARVTVPLPNWPTLLSPHSESTGTLVKKFLASSVLRPPGALLAEDDRHDNLWCRYFQTRRAGATLPRDLMVDVLYQRKYTFEWLNGTDAWDEVTCDA